jgi:hypothetical protein
VIGGLVEEQAARVGSQDLSQQDPQLEAAGEGGKWLVVELRRNAETLENLSGAGLETIAVEAYDQVLHLCVPFAVEMLYRSLENAILFSQCAPQLLMTHHCHVENSGVLETEMVLGEDTQPQPLGHRDDAVTLLLDAGDDPQEGALAGAVCAD